MRILGIDPGIARTGWGIINENFGDMQALVYDCFETKASLPTPQRLKNIHEHLHHIITEYKPDAMAIEELFFSSNAKTAMVIGQARGVVLLSSSLHGLPISVYTPLQVKIALTGYGRAEKDQVGRMVKLLLKLPKIPKPDDTADALAVAVTHGLSYKLTQKQKEVL